MYGEMLASIGKKDTEAYTYAARLEEAEDAMLRRFESALSDIQSAPLREVIMAQLPKMRRCHDDMQRLKTALAA
jgi:uncharacterized protein (TIGR02284 family)